MFALGFVVVLGLAGLSTEALPRFSAPAQAISIADATPPPAPQVAEASEPTPTSSAAPVAAAGSGPDGALARGSVVRVIDGRTILVALGSRQYTVRYRGISTPAAVRHLASTMNASLLAGHEVAVEADATNADSGSWLLGDVWVHDGSTWTLISLELAQLGLATVSLDSPNDKYADTYLAAQANARARHLGWWGLGPQSKHAKPAKASKSHKPAEPHKPEKSPKPSRAPKSD